jgi:hypothetical protein
MAAITRQQAAEMARAHCLQYGHSSRILSTQTPAKRPPCLTAVKAPEIEFCTPLPYACRRVSRLSASLRQTLRLSTAGHAATERPPDQRQSPGGELGPVRLWRYRSQSLIPRQISHTRSPASINPPSSMDQSPTLNSRKRRSAAISTFVNMICSASVKWIGTNVTPGDQYHNDATVAVT